MHQDTIYHGCARKAPSCARQRVVLEELPHDDVGRDGMRGFAKVGWIPVYRCSWPGMTSSADLVVDHLHSLLASRPVLTRHIGLLNEYRGSTGAAIMLCPCLQPLRDCLTAHAGVARVSHQGVSRPVKLKNGNGSTWVASLRDGRKCPANGGNRGNMSGHITRKQADHSPAVRQARRVDAARIDTKRRLELREQIAYKEDIVGLGIIPDCHLISSATVPTWLPTWPIGPLWVDHQKVLLICQVREAAIAFLLATGLAETMKTKDECLAVCRLIASRDVETIATRHVIGGHRLIGAGSWGNRRGSPTASSGDGGSDASDGWRYVCG